MINRTLARKERIQLRGSQRILRIASRIPAAKSALPPTFVQFIVGALEPWSRLAGSNTHLLLKVEIAEMTDVLMMCEDTRIVNVV